MVFTIIVGTVVIQSLSGGLVARWLGIANPDPNGVLIVGANRVALAYAEALQSAGHRVLVASTSWDGISKARMAGIPVFYGSPVSSYAERHLELIGLGRLLALSHRPGINELACVKYRYEFGRESVYTVKHDSESSHEKHQVSGEAAGRVLFDGKTSMNDLLALFGGKFTTRTTELTESFSYADYREQHPDRTILFITTPNGRIRFPVGEEKMKLTAGSKITAFVAEEQE
jgi:CPA1 family monovalent cation:H+ antiporter